MNISIQKITPHDDAAICHIIKTVGAEFGAIGDGFGPSDAEVLHMSEHYCASMRSQYWVARIDGVVVAVALRHLMTVKRPVNCVSSFYCRKVEAAGWGGN